MQNKSTLKQAEKVREIVDEWYEPGRQDRSFNWIYLHKVKPEFCISKRTFDRYLKTIPTKKKRKKFLNDDELY